MKKPPRPVKPAVRPSALQAESLQHTRREHALETAEDYVEAIADLSASQGEARVVDLARRLGVNYLSPISLLCDSDGCLTRVPDDPRSLIGWDYAHLTIAGSEYLTARFPSVATDP